MIDSADPFPGGDAEITSLRACSPLIPKTYFPVLRFASILGFIILTITPTASCADSFSALIQPVFREHCTGCHGEEGKVKGKVNLFEIESLSSLAGHTELLQELVDVVEFQEMPPEDEPQLSGEVRAELLVELNRLLRNSVNEKKAYPQSPMRRMTRFQYSNAVEDLFDLKVTAFTLPEEMLREIKPYFNPATGVMPQEASVGCRPLGKSQLIQRRLGGVVAFPQDLRAEHGFDNRGDHLTLSPLLMESFLKLSRSIFESPDFNAKNCGKWQEWFADPGAEAGDLDDEFRSRIRSILYSAFRSDVDEATIDRYMELALAKTGSGMSFTETMKMIGSAALASPRFLYLYDKVNSSGESEAATDYELASRLSFFLWGSIPDKELLALADSGKLSDPATLRGQADRMLNHKKLKRFCDSFPSQWLQLDRLVSSLPDPEEHPEFYFAKFRVSMHMMLEPLLLFETVLIENRPVIELIDPDFSFRSDLLQSWYKTGKKGKSTPPTMIVYDRVPITDRREGGVITNAAVMTMTSNATRTQPITRGAWIGAVIFNDPPEPPPGDVPPLPEEPLHGEENMTLRERLDAHRERKDCKGCHAQIDPLGFAMENYGPTGLWRDTYENGREVDSGGVLFRKHSFNSPVEFKDAILAEKERFVSGFAGHILSFALGRELSPADSLALDSALDQCRDDDFQFRDIIKEIVMSEPFRYKSNFPDPSSVAQNP